MKNKVFLAIGLVLAVSVMLLVVSRIVITNRSKVPQQADTLKVTDASKEEAELFDAAYHHFINHFGSGKVASS